MTEVFQISAAIEQSIGNLIDGNLLIEDEDYPHINFYSSTLMGKSLLIGLPTEKGDLLFSESRSTISFVRVRQEEYFKKLLYFIEVGCNNYEDSRKFSCPQEDANRFAEKWKVIDERLLEKEHRKNHIKECENNFYKDLITACKSDGRIDIKDYCEKNFKYIREFRVNPILEPMDFVYTVEAFIKNQISDDNLNGVIDTQRHLYTDRDLIVHEQRNININIQMDFNSLVQQLGNKGILLTSVQCPQCGSPCDLPSSGDHFNCKSCGSSVHVTDIFEKFKSFLL